MKIESRVKRLNGLYSADAVRDVLLHSNAFGVRHCNLKSPIASYLMDAPNVKWVNVSSLWVIFSYAYVEIMRRMEFTQPVIDFLFFFDKGRYPELEAKK